jgi:hypothetical protein
MDTRPERSIFLDLAERLGLQVRFQERRTIQISEQFWNRSIERRGVSGTTDPSDSQVCVMMVEELRQSAEVGLLDYGLTPPLGHAKK